MDGMFSPIRSDFGKKPPHSKMFDAKDRVDRIEYSLAGETVA
jgi:hypothetical protein